MLAQVPEQAAGPRQPKQRRLQFDSNEEADDPVSPIPGPHQDPAATAAPSMDVLLPHLASTGKPTTTLMDSNPNQASTAAAASNIAGDSFLGKSKPLQGLRYCLVGFPKEVRDDMPALAPLQMCFTKQRKVVFKCSAPV